MQSATWIVLHSTGYSANLEILDDIFLITRGAVSVGLQAAGHLQKHVPEIKS